MATPKVLILMADYGHDPTETSVPYSEFKKAGFDVQFATETGNAPSCDGKLLEGITQKILNGGMDNKGATKEVCGLYKTMKADPAMEKPLAWTTPGFPLMQYDLLFFPGGHEKGVKQLIDSPIVHTLVAEYFPQTLKPSRKTVAAICHGVMVLSESTLPDGKSVLHDATTTALPGFMESVAFWGTRAFMGDYYKTYGAGSENVETSVRKRLNDHKKQYRNSMSLSPYIHEDEKYNYISGRFPPDAERLAKAAIALVQKSTQA